MNKYDFNATLYISAKSSVVIGLRPVDYLYCENEDELRYEIINTLYEHFDSYSFTNVYDRELEWDYPQDFLDEWRRLKKSE